MGYGRARLQIAPRAFSAFLLAWSLLAHAADGPYPYYDELFEPSGRVRPQYEAVYRVYRGMDPEARERFLRNSKKRLSGDNSIDPLPRLLTEFEYELLKEGVEQRGTALRMFLEEWHRGGTSYTAVLPKAVVDRIAKRTGDDVDLERIRELGARHDIRFPYGPDLVRLPSGSWAVIEDNQGWIGGPGDLLEAREILQSLEPGYRSLFESRNDALAHFEAILGDARKRVGKERARILQFQIPPYPDNEDLRLKKLYRKLGVETATPRWFREGKLKVEKDGLFFKSGPEKRWEKVDFLLLNAEHDHLYWHASKELRSLWKGILSGKIPTQYTPAVNLIDDKEFYSYVDDLVLHYTGTKPYLPSLPTERFSVQGKNGKPALNEALWNEVFTRKGYRSSVIKRVDGRGGDSVWIGTKLTDKEMERLMPKIRAEPDLYIVQPYSHLSVIEDRIVDLRMIAQVGPEGVRVSPVPFGRGTPLSGDGKVNISLQGREFAVIVVPDPPEGSPSLCMEFALTH